MRGIFGKSKSFLDKNKPVVLLVALFAAGGAVAFIRMFGMSHRELPSGSGAFKTAPFDSSVTTFKAPTMQRSEPGALIQTAGAFGEDQAEVKGEPSAKVARPKRPATGPADSVAAPPIPPYSASPGARARKLDKNKGFENPVGAQAGGGSAAAASGERPSAGGTGAQPEAGAGSGGGGAGTGPLSTLRRNMAILAGRASRAFDGGGSQPGGKITGNSGTVFSGAGNFSTTGPGAGASSAGGGAVTGAGSGSGLALVSGPGAFLGGKDGGTGRGGGGGGGGDGGGDGGGGGSPGPSPNNPPPVTPPTPDDCKAACVKRCNDAGTPGSATCLNACYKTNGCDASVEDCAAPPDWYDPVPPASAMLPVVQGIANGMPDTVKVACVDGHPYQHKFLDTVIDALNGVDETGAQAAPGTAKRWGYVCSRGNCGTLSRDAIGFYEGETPRHGSKNLMVIDIIQDCGGSLNKPQWLVFCYHEGPKFTCTRDKGCPTVAPSPSPSPSPTPGSPLRPVCQPVRYCMRVGAGTPSSPYRYVEDVDAACRCTIPRAAPRVPPDCEPDDPRPRCRGRQAQQ